MLMNWVQFGQGAAEPISTMEMVCFLWCLRFHSEDAIAEDDLMEEIWSFLKAHSLACLTVGWDFSWTVSENFYTWPPRVAWAPSQNCPGWERERQGDGERKKKKRERERIGGRCVIFSNLVLKVTLHQLLPHLSRCSQAQLVQEKGK